MKESLIKHYKSLDTIPHWNFRMAVSKSMPQFCRVGFDEHSEDEATQQDIDALKVLRDEHERIYGLNKFVIDLDRLQNQLSLAKQTLFITKNRIHQNDIHRIEIELKELLETIPESGVLDTERLIIHLAKWWGQPVNERKMSVIRFNLLIEERNADIQRQIDQVNAQKNG